MAKFVEKRKHRREPYDAAIDFTVLYIQSDDLNRVPSSGTIISFCPSGIGITTSFPLEPGHIIQWDDIHKKGKLHIALVKWSQKVENFYRAGLMFI